MMVACAEYSLSATSRALSFRFGVASIGFDGILS